MAGQVSLGVPYIGPDVQKNIINIINSDLKELSKAYKNLFSRVDNLITEFHDFEKKVSGIKKKLGRKPFVITPDITLTINAIGGRGKHLRELLQPLINRNENLFESFNNSTKLVPSLSKNKSIRDLFKEINSMRNSIDGGLKILESELNKLKKDLGS